MHLGVACTWSAIFRVLFRRAAWPQRLTASRWGALKIAALRLFLQRPPSFTPRWWIQLAGHIPFVGLPIAAVASGGREPREAIAPPARRGAGPTPPPPDITSIL